MKSSETIFELMPVNQQFDNPVCHNCNPVPLTVDSLRNFCDTNYPIQNMGQQLINDNMNNNFNKSQSGRSGYHQKALAEIKNSLQPFAYENGLSSAASTISSISTASGSTTSGYGSERSPVDDQIKYQKLIQSLISYGYDEVS